MLKGTDPKSPVAVMAHRLETCQILQFEEAFNLYDVKKTGFVSVLDLPQLMCLLGYEPSTEELAQCVATSKEEGLVNILEFLDLMAERVMRDKKEKKVLKNFRLYDVNGTGFVTTVQMHILLHEYQGIISEEEIEEIVPAKNLNTNGKIAYDKLVKAIVKRMP